MQRYSHFFSTIYDEQQPIGTLGRGAHYSVLRAVIWNPTPKFHDFAVIWDEDHDLRVIWVIEQMYMQNLLAPALAIGERKGSITVLTESVPTDKYKGQIDAITTSVPSDSFPSTVDAFATATGLIISADEIRVRAYLAGIAALWSLGNKDPTLTAAPFDDRLRSGGRQTLKG